MKLLLTRFKKQYVVDIVSFYIKGKNTSVNYETLRFLVRSPEWSWINSLGITSDFQLMKPVLGHFANDSRFSRGVCQMTGIPMSQRPECLGDIEPLLFVDVQSSYPKRLRFKNYNYYLLEDANFTQIEGIIKQFPCLEIL